MAQVCDRVAIMYAGEIVESGTIAEVFDHPHHPYTIGLFGSIPSLDETAEKLKPIQGQMPDPTELPEGCAFAPRCPYATGPAVPASRRSTASAAPRWYAAWPTRAF